jgi:hypothetical protein
MVRKILPGEAVESNSIAPKDCVPVERQGALAVGFVWFLASGWGTHHWADIGMFAFYAYASRDS